MTTGRAGSGGRRLRPDGQLSRWLVPLIARYPLVSGELMRIIESRGDGGDGDRDLWLLIRRATELAMAADPMEGITADQYRQAAATLRRDGHGADAAGLEALAAVSPELEQADREWRGRYARRPQAAAGQGALRLLAGGRLWAGPADAEVAEVAGVDGATYSAAAMLAPAGGAIPVVVAITPAGSVEVIEFGDADDRAAWLDDRRLPSEEPGLDAASALASSLNGPACRTAREDRALAGMLRGGLPDQLAARLQARSFSTYPRSEIWLAASSLARAGAGRDPGSVRHEFARRVLRAPGWAAAMIGWPFRAERRGLPQPAGCYSSQPGTGDQRRPRDRPGGRRGGAAGAPGAATGTEAAGRCDREVVDHALAAGQAGTWRHTAPLAATHYALVHLSVRTLAVIL